MSGLRLFWRRFRRNRAAVAGLVVLLLVVAAAIFGPMLHPLDPFDMVGRPTQPPSARFLLGTDVSGRDILAGLLLLGARAIFVTHVHELVDDLLDGESPAPGVVSLVAGYTPPAGNGAEPAPSYQIAPGRPQVAGYAAELARRHGLSLGQIAATLRQRGVDIPPAEDGEGRAAGD